MKGWLLSAAFAAVICSSCGDDGKNAGLLLQRAEASFSAGDFNTAKLQVDSIRTLYPKAIEARRAAIGLMQQVELQEQEKTLVYLDSMLAVKRAEFDSMRGKFVFEKDTAYQEVGNYFHPSQVVERNIGRSFLRAQVNEMGEMSLTSIYCAGGNIHHTAVRVGIPGDTYAETPVSSDVYETTDLGRPIEKADYRLPADGGVAAFIVANKDRKSLALEFKGDRSYKTQMTAEDIKAVAAVGDLARVLAGMEEIRKEQKEANLKKRFILKKMEEKKAGNGTE